MTREEKIIIGIIILSLVVLTITSFLFGDVSNVSKGCENLTTSVIETIMTGGC